MLVSRAAGWRRSLLLALAWAVAAAGLRDEESAAEGAVEALGGRDDLDLGESAAEGGRDDLNLGEPLPRRLGPKDKVECDGTTWVIDSSLGRGAQGKVWAVREASGGPIRAMKMDLEPGAAYHTKVRSRNKRGAAPLETGTKHESIPECGILEALQAKGISLVPRCFAACSPEGHNTVVMTAVEGRRHVSDTVWEGLKSSEQRALINANTKHLFQVVQAEVAPTDVEAYIDRDNKLLMIDWGGASATNGKGYAKYAGGPNHVLFESSVPHAIGISSIAFGLCRLDRVKDQATYDKFMPLFLGMVGDAFCGSHRDFEPWVVTTVRASIKQGFRKCRPSDFPDDFLECSR